MLKRVLGELPSWAQANNPLLAYEIGRHAPRQTIQARTGRVVFFTILLVFLLLGGYLYATAGLQNPPQPLSVLLWRSLIFPLLFLQLILRGAGLVLGAGSVNEERRRQTWEPLRATEIGASVSLRSRWFSILSHRLRPLLIAIWSGRVVLLAAMLLELASLEGDVLGILLVRSQPSVGIVLGLILLAAQLAAFFLLPFTATGVDVALGLLISARVRSRAFASVILTLVILFRIVSSVLLFWVFAQFAAGTLELGSFQAWFVQAGNAVFGDWGLAMVQLIQTGQRWASIPYSIFIGLVMLGAVLLQTLFAEGLLRIAAHVAELSE